MTPAQQEAFDAMRDALEQARAALTDLQPNYSEKAYYAGINIENAIAKADSAMQPQAHGGAKVKLIPTAEEMGSPTRPQASEPQAQGEAIPPEGSERADALIKAMLKEYGYPSSTLNAARAGYRAARLAAPALPAAAMPVGELTEKVVNLPIPASAADLKSDIAELIQSHKYKGLRSIEVLGVFQFIGAEIISGSNS